VVSSVATDYRCRVISAYLEDVDTGGPDGAQFGGPALPEVGEVVSEFEVTRAWLNDCCWSPSGAALAFVGHDSMLHVATWPSGAGSGSGAAEDPSSIQSVKCPTLPGTRVLFLTEALLVVAGHGMNPELFARSAEGVWRFLCYVDRKQEDAGAGAKVLSGAAAARAMFASKVTRGQAAGADDAASSSSSWMRHNNAITYLKAFRVAASGAVTAFSTSGDDGRVVVWDLEKLALPDVVLQ
jgi:actin related protein 2/3 complex subunit 1A/1B